MSGRPEPHEPRKTPESPEGDADDAGAEPPVHERWWWTGTFRAVLGGVVVGFQWPVLTTGEATAMNWVVAAVGAAVVTWGCWLVWTAWRDLEGGSAG